MASGQDIHICGICRTGFSDIWQFIQHKKDSCSGDSVIPLSGQGCVEAVPVVQTPNLNSAFNCNVQDRGFVASNASRLKTEIRNQDASSSYKGKVQSELYNKLSQPDSDNVLSNSTIKDTVVLSSSQVSEAIKYSHPKPSSTSVPQSSPKITHSRPMHSNAPQKDFIFHHNVRNESKKVLNDDIAVFIVSPKSFGSSVTTPKSFQTSRENVVAKLHCSATFENDDLEVINSTNTLNDFQVSECGAREAETYQAPTVHVFLPETSSCFYTDSSLLSGSDTSTPCPEDLEVGQISASVLGQSPLAPTSSERNFVSNQTNNPLNSARSVVSYSRLNTASAPSIVAPAREQSNQKLGLEKRERLKGLSDDLLASCHQAEPATQGNDYFPQSKPPITSSCTSQAKVKSFKAVFTSPSRCGHRLSPTQDLHHLMPPRSSFSQRVLDTNSGHSALPQGKTRLYKNISAALKTQQRLADMQKGERLLLKDDTPRQTRRQGAEREILFDNDCSVLKPSPSSQRPDKVGAMGQVTTRITYPTSSMAASVNVKCVEALSAPPSLPVDSVQVSRLPREPNTSGVVGSKSVQELDTVSLLANKSVQELDPTTCTKTSITTVTAALTQQTPTATVSCFPVSKQPSQTYQTNAGQDTILVYKNQGTNFLIMPDVIQMVPALQIPEQSRVAQRLSEASPVALTMEISKHGQHHTTLASDVLPLSLPNQTSKQVLLQMHDMLPDQQPPHSVYVLKQNGGSDSGSTMTTPAPNCGQLVTTVTSSRESQIQCSNQGDVTNLFSYQQASQVSSLTSCTLATEMGAVTSQAPCSKEISDGSQRHNQVSGTSARELCIIRPAKASPRRLKAVTENPAFNTQPQYEVNTSDANQPSGSNKKEKVFTCKFDKCRYSSKMYKDFRRHYRTHTGETPYTCLECGKTFSRSDKLRLHQRAHDGLKPFHCHLCDYKTLESGNLKKHLRIHSDERPYKCQICPYASRNSSHLIVHLRSHTGDAPFVCSECGAQFRIGTDLKRHMRTHTGEKPFKCDLCDYRCAHKGNLKSHMRINHSKEGEVSCDHCDFSSSSRKQLKAHAKLHDPSHCFRCQQCPLAFPSARALRAHLCTHDTVKPYQCSYCPYACKRSGNLKKHVLRHHMDKLIQKTQAKSKTKKRTAATDLGAAGSTKRRRKPVGGGERHMEYLQQHKCELCGRGFVRLDSLLSHMNQHKREQGQDQKSKLLDHQAPSVAVSGSPPSSSSQVSTNLPTGPQASRQQGMRHIAAAASKLFEENYGNSKQTLISKSPGREVVESGQESFSCRRSANVKNIIPHEVAASATEITHQLPWEHSYTTCLPQTSGQAQSGSSSEAPGQLTQESAHGPHKRNLPPYHSGGKKAKLLHQPAPGDQSQVLTRGHHLQPSQESTTKMEMKGRGQPRTYQQREASASQDTSYSFQIVPQVVTPAQLIEQIVIPQSQLQPSPHIQIVVPRAAASTHQASQIVVPRAAVSNQQPTSSQVIRLPGSAQQQVLVQDYKGSNQMEVVSLPYSQQSTKIFQMVTSTGLVTFDPSPGQH